MKPAFGQLLGIWWAFTWRVGLISVVAMFIMQLLLVLLLKLLRAEQQLPIWSGLVQIVLSLGISLWGFRYLFDMDFKGLQLVLVPVDSLPTANEPSQQQVEPASDNSMPHAQQPVSSQTTADSNVTTAAVTAAMVATVIASTAASADEPASDSPVADSAAASSATESSSAESSVSDGGASADAS